MLAWQIQQISQSSGFHIDEIPSVVFVHTTQLYNTHVIYQIPGTESLDMRHTVTSSAFKSYNHVHFHHLVKISVYCYIVYMLIQLYNLLGLFECMNVCNKSFIATNYYEH